MSIYNLSVKFLYLNFKLLLTDFYVNSSKLIKYI